MKEEILEIYDLKNASDVWEVILELNIATNDELNLVTDINGYNMETLNDVIYARTGYRDICQYLEYEV